MMYVVHNRSKPSKAKKVRMSVTLDPDVLVAVRKLALVTHTSVSQLVQEALEDKISGCSEERSGAYE